MQIGIFGQANSVLVVTPCQDVLENKTSVLPPPVSLPQLASCEHPLFFSLLSEAVYLFPVFRE